MKYYKAEDVINTLADQWHFEATMEYPDTAGNIEEWKENARELFADLPTIEVSEDAISREWLLNLYEELAYLYKDVETDSNKILAGIIQNIKNAPSVVPTTEQSSEVGEWIDNGDRYFRCSLCGIKDTDTYKWCHGCGSVMKG